MKAIILISHGSRSATTKKEIEALIADLKRKISVPIMSLAFLEIEKPAIPEEISNCVKQGATEIVLLLNFLNSGRHIDADIPNILQEARKKYPSVRFKMTTPVGQHPAISDLFLDMIKAQA